MKIERICMASLFACVVSAVLITGSFAGITPLSENWYNSYTLQALAWLRGSLSLPVDYPHLELAYYNGGVFVSFPPFPSLLMLPFAAVFGENAPEYVISVTACGLAAVYIYRLGRALGLRADVSYLLALFSTVGANFLFISVMGAAVWFFAQILAFLFTAMAFYYAAKCGRSGKNTYLAALFLAFAVGCRPFQIIYAPVLLYFYWRENPAGLIKRTALYAAPATAVCVCYLALNYARFGNPFEFGHNYLPEFAYEHDQFSVSYIADNLKSLFRLPFFEGGRLAFHRFNGTAFWIVSPAFLSLAAHFIFDIFRNRKFNAPASALIILIAIHFIILCSHKTMGGWHFGHRYTIDALPAAALALCLLWRGRREGLVLALNAPLFISGAVINLIGTYIILTT